MRLPRRFWEPLLLAALILLAYGPTLSYGFVWDDHEQVVNNPRLTTWQSLPELWSRDILALSRQGGERSNYYRPLFFTTYLVLFQLFGLNAMAWHGAALLAHLLASLAARAFLRRLGLGEAAALTGAALFALHPAHGESVAWVAAAFNDPPAAALIFLALAAHCRYLEEGHKRWLVGGAAVYAAALLFKESALSLVLLLPLVTQLRMPQATLPARLLAWLPSWGVTGLYLGARKLLLGSFLGVYSGPGWGEILPTLPRLGLEYLRFLLWPWGYAPSYPLRFVDGWASPVAWGSVALLLALGALLVWLGRRWPWVSFAGLWFALATLPALNIRTFRPTYLVHQRYLYPAVFGLCGLLAWLLWEKLDSKRWRAASLTLLLFVWTASLWVHNRAWASDVALWQRVAEVDPGNPASFDWLGARALAQGRVDEAEALFHRAIEADPEAPTGTHNLALALQQGRNRPAEALVWFERALERYATRPQLGAERARCRVSYGLALAAVGRAEEALAEFRAAAEEPPYSRDGARNAAVLLARSQRSAEARSLLEAALIRHPGDATLSRMLADLRGPSPTPGR